MVIERISKSKNNYTIHIKDNKYKINEDVLVKHSLFKGKEIDEETLKDIINDNIFYEVYNKALKYLSYKMRSEKQVYDYLIKDYDKDVILKSISKLKEIKIINDKIFAKAYINDQLLLTNNGPNKIKRNLNKLGINYTEEIEHDFTEKLDKIINRRLKSNKDSLYTFKQKTSKYLMNLGYTNNMYSDILNEVDFDETANLKKELTKLQRRFDNDKIRDRLYRRGYNMSKINKVMEELWQKKK